MITKMIKESSIDTWISKTVTFMLYPELSYILLKFGVNPLMSSEVMSQNVICSDDPYLPYMEMDHLDNIAFLSCCQVQ